MNIKLIIAGSAFILAGLVFTGLGIFISRNDSAKKSSAGKNAKRLFLLAGALTFVIGLIFVSMQDVLNKSTAEIIALVYLVILTIILTVFSFLIKGKKKDE